MLGMETIAKGRRAYFVQKKPIKAICCEYRLSDASKNLGLSEDSGARLENQERFGAGQRGREPAAPGG
jgi:hypothetical protein